MGDLVTDSSKELSERLVALETCSQSDEGTWPVQKKTMTMTMTMTMTRTSGDTFKEQPWRLFTFETFDNYFVVFL